MPIWRILETSRVKLHLVNPYFIKQLPGSWWLSGISCVTESLIKKHPIITRRLILPLNHDTAARCKVIKFVVSATRFRKVADASAGVGDPVES